VLGRGARGLALSLLVALAACGPRSDGMAGRAPEAATAPPLFGGPQPLASPDPRTSGTVVPRSHRQPAPVLVGGAGMARPGAVGGGPGVSSDGAVTFDFMDADIREIARYILGEVLEVNFTIDPDVQGTATLQTTEPIADAQVLAVLQTLLLQNGATLAFENGLYRVMSEAGLLSNVPFAGGDSRGAFAGGTVVELRFLPAERVAAAVEPFLRDTTRAVPVPGRNALVVTGTGPARNALVSLIRALDVDMLSNQAYALYPVEPGEATAIALEVERVIDAEGAAAVATVVRVIPLERANALLIISPEEEYVVWTMGLLDQIAGLFDATSRRLRLYYPQNVQAADLQPVLQRVFLPGVAIPETLPGTVTPASEPVGIGGLATGATTGAQTIVQGVGVPQPSPEQRFATLDTDPALVGTTSSVIGGGSPGGLQIVADPKRNALLLFATDEEYALLQAALERLDVLPRQVLIEATIAEVTLNDQLRYGTQFFFRNNDFRFILSGLPPAAVGADLVSNASLFPGLFSPAIGSAIGRTEGSSQFIIQALQQITDVVVISAPQVLILENERAQLQVGSLVPVTTQSAVSVITPDAPVVSNIEYRETGVILTVVPRINSGGLVTLTIQQEVSDVVETTSSNIDSPTFQTRNISSTVAVRDGETIALAGLIRDSSSRGRSGIPVLQHIPILGPLFGTRTGSQERTELIVLLTPYVVEDERDARAITEELRRKLTPGSLFPLQRQPLYRAGT
jgi:general secretion pathway protein D